MQANILSALGVKKPVVSTFSNASAAQFSGQQPAQSPVPAWTDLTGLPRAYVLPQPRFGQSLAPADRLPVSKSRVSSKAAALEDELVRKTGHVLAPFQRQGIETLAEGKSPVVCAPTSSGKTLVAEAAILDALGSGKKLFYTAPMKAISVEKYHDFCKRYGADKVGLITGDICKNPNAPLVLMTTEILRDMLYQPERSQSSLRNLQYIVFDECHYISDEDRGGTWEEAMMYSRKYFPDIQQVHLSATVPNAAEYTDWLNSLNTEQTLAGEFDLIASDNRPVPLTVQYLGPEGLVDMLDRRGEPSTDFSRAFQKNERPPMNGRASDNGRTGRRSLMGKVDPLKEVSALKEHEQLPAIVFNFRRKACEEDAAMLFDNGVDLVSGRERQRIRQIVKRYTDAYPGLKKLQKNTTLPYLERGIAYHHADLLPAERELVQVLLKEGLLKAVFSTPTLAVGVNVPAQTVCINSYGGDSEHPITRSMLHQMMGRTGRLGMYEEGFVVFTHLPGSNKSQLVRMVQSEPEPVQSSLRISPNMVLSWLGRLTRPEIEQLLEQSFVAYQEKDQAAPQSARGKARQRNVPQPARRLKDDLDKMQAYLKGAGFVGNRNGLTPLGRVAAQIPMDSSLLITKALTSSALFDWQSLSPAEFAAVLSTTLVNESKLEKAQWHSSDPELQPLEHPLQQLYRLKDLLDYNADWSGVSTGSKLEPMYMENIARWCKTHDIAALEDHPGILNNLVLQTNGLMRKIAQMKELPDELREKAEEASRLLIDGIVAEQIDPKEVVID